MRGNRLLTFFILAVAPSLCLAGEKWQLEVRETAGIQRFSYPVAGEFNVVDTAATAERFGPGLDLFQKMTLDTGYKVQEQARVVLHGPTFALLDTPVTFRCGDKNRMVRYRYALLVDPPTGRLDVLAWRLGAEGGGCSDLTRAVLLHPNTIDEAELIPDPAEFNAIGIPNELAFGVDDLPPHRLEVALPPHLSAPAGKTKFAPDDARALEDGLRKLLPPG